MSAEAPSCLPKRPAERRREATGADPGAGPISDPDCALNEASPGTSGCYLDSLKVGRQGGKEQRAVMRFQIADALPRDAEVFNASLGMTLRSQTAPTLAPTSISVNRATHSWSSGAGWDRYDGTNRWGSPGGDFADAQINQSYEYAGGTSGLGTSYFNIGQAITDWQTYKYPNYGMVVREADSSKDNLLSFDSAETVGGQAPQLFISYQRRLGERPGYKLEEFTLNDRMALKVNSATGNLLLRQTDLSVPGGLGPDTTVGRTYNSYQPGPASPAYGQNWTMDTASGVFLENQGNFYQQLYGPSGWAAQFNPATDAGGNRTYPVSPAGIDGKLSKDSGSGQHTLTMNKSQTKYVFEAVASGVRARLLRVEDRNGRKVSFAYTGTTSQLASITDNQDRVTTFVYDTASRLTKMTDPAGRNSSYVYDATTGFLSTYTDAAGGITRYFYDSTGRLTKVTTPGGRSTTVVYYPTGHADAGKVKQVTRVTNSPNAGDGPTTKFVYDAHRDTSSDAYVTDPLDHETRYSFDTQSRVTGVVDALGNKQATTYDARSNVDSYSAPGSSTGSSNLTKTTHDSDGNLTGTATPTTQTPVAENGKAIRTSASFPASGSVAGGTFLPSSTKDAQGQQTAYAYDAAGNPTQVAQQGNAAASVSFVYSATSPGRVDKSKDGLGKETVYGYDAKGNLTSIAPPSASIGATTIGYAGAAGADLKLSRVSSITRPVAGTESYKYDALDRATEVAYSDGKTVTTTYDPDGNATQVVDSAVGAGTRTQSYDALNRLLTQAGPNSASYTYRYDLSSNLTSVQDNNGTTEYGYDAANRGISVYEPGVSAPVKFGLDDRGNRVKTTLPNGTITEQDFNEASQLKRSCLRPGSDTGACSSSTAGRLLDFKYTYRERAGAPGQGMNVGELQETVTDKDDKLTLNCYDDLNRVVRVETGTATMPPAFCEDPAPASTSSDWWSYGFDLAGNITGSQRKGATQQSFAYADGNRLCWKNNGASTNTCATPPAGATTYSYDAAGQETAVSGARASTYNARQQLTSLTGVTGIGYFATGQSDLSTAGGSTHRSGVLGLSQIGSDSYVRDESGGLVSQSTSGGRQYVHTDALGSVRALTNSTGAVSNRLDYDPYGQPTSAATPGSSTSRFGYAQGENIGAGLTHYGERYYDPAIMRWTQPDPLLNSDDIRQANRYAYAANDPINNSDPSGRGIKGCLIGVFVRLTGVSNFNPVGKPYGLAGACVVGSLAESGGRRRGGPCVDTPLSTLSGKTCKFRRSLQA